jgi:hypothetical protein
MVNTIPPITDPLGEYWDQPNRDDILIDDEWALMTQDTLGRLMEYSMSYPTGVYDGKMWKFRTFSGVWYLRWYGPSDQPGKYSINSRKVLLV